MYKKENNGRERQNMICWTKDNGHAGEAPNNGNNDRRVLLTNKSMLNLYMLYFNKVGVSTL